MTGNSLELTTYRLDISPSTEHNARAYTQTQVCCRVDDQPDSDDVIVGNERHSLAIAPTGTKRLMCHYAQTRTNTSTPAAPSSKSYWIIHAAFSSAVRMFARRNASESSARESPDKSTPHVIRFLSCARRTLSCCRGKRCHISGEGPQTSETNITGKRGLNISTAMRRWE